MDGRAFIKKSVQDLFVNETKTFDHFIMNLPATAIEFLGKSCTLCHDALCIKRLKLFVDAFRGLYQHKQLDSDSLPMIHCHCFTRSSDPMEDIQQVNNNALLPIVSEHAFSFYSDFVK